MRLTKAQKAANNLAAERAHHAQVVRHNSDLQAINGVLSADNGKLDGAGKRVAALLEDRDNQIKALKADIAAFKLEALQLTTELAEMRGYIGRTLEDDAVREVAAVVVDQQDCVVPTQHVPRARDTARRYGPNALRGAPSYMGGTECKGYPVGGGGGRIEPAPRHWINR